MKRLNAYKITHKFIEEGLAYLNHGKFPERLQFKSRKLEFRTRYQDMHVEKDQLFVGDRRVVPIEHVNDILASLYKELGDIGRDRFYAMIKNKYVGISRPRVQRFLDNQELHQLVRQVKRQPVNHAIVVSKPMERWQADLVDLSKYKSPQNSNTTFLLTVIDCFSKYAWVAPLRSKSASSVAAAMETIFKDNDSKAPSVLQTDNGGEFQDEFELLLRRWGVSHARSRPYNPQANGQVERFNGTLKRSIKAHMLANDTRKYVSQLKHIVATYNSLLHTGVQQIPAQVHVDSSLWPAAQAQLQKQAMRGKRRGRHIKHSPLHEGDHVRTALLTKALEKPSTFWSQDIYQVMSVQRAKREWEATQYVLHDGRRFTRDRLQKVSKSEMVPLRRRRLSVQQTISRAPSRMPPQEHPKRNPQRQRAPSSRLKDSYVDM